METLKRKDKVYSIKPFTFQYVEVVSKDDVIKGGGLYFLNKCILTIAHCNNLWIDEFGKPYNFKFDGNILFLRYVALNFK